MQFTHTITNTYELDDEAIALIKEISGDLGNALQTDPDFIEKLASMASIFQKNSYARPAVYSNYDSQQAERRMKILENSIDSLTEVINDYLVKHPKEDLKKLIISKYQPVEPNEDSLNISLEKLYDELNETDIYFVEEIKRTMEELGFYAEIGDRLQVISYSVKPVKEGIELDINEEKAIKYIKDHYEVPATTDFVERAIGDLHEEIGIDSLNNNDLLRIMLMLGFEYRISNDKILFKITHL